MSDPVFPRRAWITTPGTKRIFVIDRAPEEKFKRWKVWDIPISMDTDPILHQSTFSSIPSAIRYIEKLVEVIESFRCAYTNGASCSVTADLGRDVVDWYVYDTGRVELPSGAVPIKGRMASAVIENVMDGVASLWTQTK